MHAVSTFVDQLGRSRAHIGIVNLRALVVDKKPLFVDRESSLRVDCGNFC